MMRLKWLLLPALAVVVALVMACGDDAGPDPTVTPVPTNAPLTGSITIFAAASLTDAFNEMATEFKKANSEVNITFNFGGSPTLRTQLEQGARADIFASADTVQMTNAVTSGVVRDAGKVFVKNSLVIIVPKSNPGKITVPADLKKGGLKIVLAAPEVPVGNYARQSLALMDKDASFGAGFSDAVLKNVVSNESNVKQVVAKVQLGEADAGIVYGTDVTAAVANDITKIDIPAALNVIAEYPIALTKDAGNARTAQGFIDFVLSKEGQAVLKKYGFQAVA